MIRSFMDHAANERTFLAWVRTAIAIVGLGLAAARFADSGQVWSEVALIGSGLVVIIVAWLRMLLVRRRIISQQELDDRSFTADSLLVVLMIALLGMISFFVLHVG